MCLNIIFPFLFDHLLDFVCCPRKAVSTVFFIAVVTLTTVCMGGKEKLKVQTPQRSSADAGTGSPQKRKKDGFFPHPQNLLQGRGFESELNSFAFFFLRMMVHFVQSKKNES